MRGNNGKADIVDKFTHVLNLQSNTIFSDCAYKINEIRQRDLRAPEKMAYEQDVNKLRVHRKKH